MNSLSFSLGGNSSKPSPSSSRRSSPPPKRNGTKRDHSALLDDASDDEDASAGKRQNITHFDTSAGGAVDANRKKVEEKKALVIQPLANRDWREASKALRAQKYGITPQPKENGAQQDESAEKVVREKDGVRYGLNIFEAQAPAPDNDGEDVVAQQDVEEEQSEKQEEKTDEQRAIDALTGVEPVSTLTIPAAATEEEAFANSYHAAPSAPSLDEYAAVPVEEYGAAMLRGMGWKGPSTTTKPTSNTKKAPPPAKRPTLLGIGANPDAAVAEELGAWGKPRGRQKEIVYNPLIYKNPKTGERLTEEELQAKMRDQNEREADEKFVVEDLEIRDKKRDDEKRDRRRRDRSEDYDREREKRHRRDRERDYDRRDRDRDREYPRGERGERSERSNKDHRREKERNHDRRDRERDHNSSRKDRYDDEDKYSRRDREHRGEREREGDRMSSRRERRYDDDDDERGKHYHHHHRSSRR